MTQKTIGFEVFVNEHPYYKPLDGLGSVESLTEHFLLSNKKCDK